MSGLGLIFGAALAGGMQGGGEAGRTAVAANQEAQNKEDLVKMQAQMEMEKDVKIAAINQDYHVQNTATDFGNQQTLEQNRQTFEGGQKAADRQNLKDITGMQGKNALDVAAAQGANALAVAGVQAKMSKYTADLQANHLSVTSGADGHYWLVNNQTGETQAMKDPQGNPIVGVKNLPENVVLTAKSYMDQAAAVLRLNPDDEGAKQMMDTGRAMLGVAPQAPTKPIDPGMASQFTDIMTKGGRVPTLQEMSQYDAATKTPGAASLAVANWMTQHGQTATGATPGLPGTPDVAGGNVNNRPLPPGTTPGNTAVATTTPSVATAAPSAAPAPAATPAPGTAPAPAAPLTGAIGVAGSGAPMGYGEQAPAPGLIANQMQQPASRFVPRYPSPPTNYPPEPVQPTQYGSRLPSGAPGYSHGNKY